MDWLLMKFLQAQGKSEHVYRLVRVTMLPFICDFPQYQSIAPHMMFYSDVTGSYTDPDTNI